MMTSFLATITDVARAASTATARRNHAQRPKNKADRRAVVALAIGAWSLGPVTIARADDPTVAAPPPPVAPSAVAPAPTPPPPVAPSSVAPSSVAPVPIAPSPPIDAAVAAPTPGPMAPPPPVLPAHPDDPLSVDIGPDARLSLHPIVQGDARFFLAGGTNVFTPRRVRPAVEALLFDRFFVRITPEFAGTPSAVDAFVEFRILPEIQIRAGKFKAPVGLERLQQDSDLAIVERGLQSGLLPDRDVGAQLQGTIGRGILTYAIGLFDGAPDGAQIDTDVDDKKDVEGRVFVRPFAGDPNSKLRNIGLGIGATTGTHSGSLPGYKTAGQNTYFSFAATATAAGAETRVAPQIGAYVGPIGLLAEYAHNSEAVTNAGATATVSLDAWTVALAAVVTGEDATYGTLKPTHHFDPDHGGFGALELDARVGSFVADDTIFAGGFADPNKAPHKALELSGGAQWILAPGVKWVLDAFVTSFTGGGPGGTDRPTEKLFTTRFQVAI